MEENNYLPFINKLNTHDKIMGLTIYIDSDDDELKKLYVSSVTNHNQKIYNEPDYYDAGFDLFLPEQIDSTNINRIANKVDFKVKCRAIMYTISGTNVCQKISPRYTPFYTYARSSISKTPLRLANNQGIIDAGYRGNLIGMFDCISDGWTGFSMPKYSRVLQVCAPGLVPIYVTIADSIDQLGQSTSRGEGGFGSTGI
jgi:dUTP pyrophosphatase